MHRLYSSVDQIIGNTPLLELTNIQKHFNLQAKILAKLEYLNPAGSAKDRVARQMLDDAEKKGLLNKNSTIIEPTSGNTGIGLASIATSRGYKTIIIMPETMSIERQKLMKAYGAQLILTQGSKGMKGAIEKAQELAASIPNSFIPGQFSNPSNYLAHYNTTGPEIWHDCKKQVDLFVAGIGTGGTITGVGKFLKSKNKKIQIIGVEPESSPFISKGIAGSHEIQGIGAGFIPEVLDTSILDKVITVKNDDAFTCAKLVGTQEGVLVGISSGAALWASIQLAKKEENKGKTIVTFFVDSGERYLSTKMFS